MGQTSWNGNHCRGCFCLEQFVFGHDFIDGMSVCRCKVFRGKCVLALRKKVEKTNTWVRYWNLIWRFLPMCKWMWKKREDKEWVKDFHFTVKTLLDNVFTPVSLSFVKSVNNRFQKVQKHMYMCSSHVLRHLFVSHLVEINNLLRYRYRENVISLEVSWNANIGDFSHAWNELENWICLRVTCPGGSGPLTGQFAAILAPVSSTQFGSKFLTNDLQVLNSPFQQYNGIRLLFVDNLCELGAADDDCFVGFTSFTVVMIFQHAGNNKVVLCLYKW